MIKASHLSKNFGDITALSDVSFEIGKGEVVGLLGPNGAGKTTAMRILTGYLAPSSGSVSIDDLDITKNSLAIKKKIGYLPENNPLYTDQLVFEYLEFAARIKGLFKDKSKKAIQKAVSETGIAEVYYRPIGELSKGYCQRVGLAQALLGNPEILIFDEPTEGLDPNQRVEIRSLIKNLGKDKTIILSTHVMQEASAVCDRIIIINIGKIVADKNSLELGKTDIITVELTLSGNDAYEKIKAIQGIVAIDSRETRDDKEKLTINIGKGGNFERNLAKLCRENDLIIWELFRKEKGLEEIFRELTEAKP